MKDHRIYRGVARIAKYHRLNDLTSWNWRLVWKPVCSSTETELSFWLKYQPILKNQPRAIFSSRQIFGQGQHGRSWFSPPGGVWLSAAIRNDGVDEKAKELFGLAVAYALLERLEIKGIEVKIKWPNDLLVNGQKLAGCLPRLFFRGKEI